MFLRFSYGISLIMLILIKEFKEKETDDFKIYGMGPDPNRKIGRDC